LRKKLIEEYPHFIEEWVTEKNDRPIEEITIGSDYKAWWKCKKCNREWHALVISRAINNSGCPLTIVDVLNVRRSKKSPN